MGLPLIKIKGKCEKLTIILKSYPKLLSNKKLLILLL